MFAWIDEKVCSQQKSAAVAKAEILEAEGKEKLSLTASFLPINCNIMPGDVVLLQSVWVGGWEK